MQLCPRCQRANPEVAIFCYFDGGILQPDLKPSIAAVPPGHLAREFIFPPGRTCRTYDELVQACQEDWKKARQLLHRGRFAKALATMGRADLARMAQEAATLANGDLALTTFLAGLPTTRPRAPRLEVSPLRLVLGTLQRAETRSVRLTVRNQGVGRLQGILLVSAAQGGVCSWLRLADEKNPGRCVINTSTSQEIDLLVDSSGLPAGEVQNARVAVTTNGGGAEVPVRVHMMALPFPWPPFQGANGPRDMAERMRLQPKEAVEHLENGEIARWFLANGWPYPVQGPPVSGLAGVQQFFEGMGLSRVPEIRVSEPEVRMNPVYPEVVRWEVTLSTDARKWIHGQVESDVLWLKILTPAITGPQLARLSFEVDSSLLEPKRFYTGRVQVVANGGQRLTIPVRVDVQGQDTALTRRIFNS